LSQFFMHRKHCTVSNCKLHPTTFARMLVYSALYNVNEKTAFAVLAIFEILNVE